MRIGTNARFRAQESLSAFQRKGKRQTKEKKGSYDYQRTVDEEREVSLQRVRLTEERQRFTKGGKRKGADDRARTIIYNERTDVQFEDLALDAEVGALPGVVLLAADLDVQQRGAFRIAHALDAGQPFVDEIVDSETVFGEMRPRIRHTLPGIHLTVGENLGKNPTRLSAQAGIEPAPERNFRSAGKRLNRLSHAGGFSTEVDKEKKNIYNPTIPYYLQKYQLEELEVIGLVVGARAHEEARLTSRLLASRPHAEAEVDDHPTRMEVSCG
ncbi:hypothetical protein ANN_14902 [Periplaneta americana]|uniref:Uncharacterized protein n=1 Tax=Periplaneta americana TaxID=6978 RepID=A0ABQ8SYV0_PERAM|nr:hypothetical protein ANN_14902 [Periplaneta americana]